MTTLEQRQTLLGLIEQACQDGARLHKACALKLGLNDSVLFGRRSPASVTVFLVPS